LKIATIVGARPQFIKAAPLSGELRKRHSEILIHTGQHYNREMSDVFFEELGIPAPDFNLGVGSGPHGAMTGKMLASIETVLMETRPDCVIVYGDTNSTLAGALAASKLNLPVAHVEAGVRSYNRKMPEEINRLVADHLAALLFCPTEKSVNNLRREGIEKNVFNVGDVMYDAFLMFLEKAKNQSGLLKSLGLGEKEYLLLTLHRAENVDRDDRLRILMDAVGRAGTTVIFPIHPRTEARLNGLGLMNALGSNVRLIPPVGYLDMIALESHARLILTDSGGVQREACFLSIPSVILREETEWPELVEMGATRLGEAALENLWETDFSGIPWEKARDVFGTGEACRKIANLMENHFDSR
jgi:UDP-N-acetylglucosamine 2-epimerase